MSARRCSTDAGIEEIDKEEKRVASANGSKRRTKDKGATEREGGDRTVRGWVRVGLGGVGGKLNLAQDVTAPGNSDAAVWRKSRHDYGPQYVLPTVS